jgi:hypothetical protein
MPCKRTTGRQPDLLYPAISLIPRRLYDVNEPARQKLVTQKVRLRVINGEESLSPERLFGLGRK